MHPKRVISPDLSELPTEKRVFVRKLPGSIAEIQQNVNDISDVVVLLEVLGYNGDTLTKMVLKLCMKLQNMFIILLTTMITLIKIKEKKCLNHF